MANQKLNNILLKTFVIFLFLHFETTLGQNIHPDKIIISQGKCTKPCGYTNDFDNLIFFNEIEFNLKDSTTFFRKKLSKKKRSINYRQQFLDFSFISSIDSIVTNFEDIEFAMGKYYIYKIELVHVLDKNLQLPLKNKSVVFWISTNPNKKHPIKLDQIIHEYHNILLLVK